MNNADTGLLFPPRSISSLSAERGASWQNLVVEIEKTGPDSPEQMAFILMMARLNSCANCNADSYRAIHGCSICARQSLKRFQGTDLDLSGMYHAARTEVLLFLQKKA
jgi:hypothetical protein